MNELNDKLGSELSDQLREYAHNTGYSHADYSDVMIKAAKYIENKQAKKDYNELDINRLIVDIEHLRIDNTNLIYALEQSEEIIEDLAQLVKRLISKLRKTSPDNELSKKALDYLKRKNLLESPLRKTKEDKNLKED